MSKSSFNPEGSSEIQKGEYNQPSPSFIPSTPLAVPPVVPYSDQPTPCICPNCRRSIITRVELSNGALVWILVTLILCFGGFLGCFLIPFCIDSLKDVSHYCPHCNILIRKNKKL